MNSATTPMAPHNTKGIVSSTIYDETTKTAFHVEDFDSAIKDIKFSFDIGDGCDSDLFGDDAFAVTGKGNDRVIVSVPEEGVESDKKCIITMTATDGQWDTKVSFIYERLTAMTGCASYAAAGQTKDGIYLVDFYGTYETPVKVYCAFTDDGSRSWTLFESASLSTVLLLP
jgi:hypothetical protein